MLLWDPNLGSRGPLVQMSEAVFETELDFEVTLPARPETPLDEGGSEQQPVSVGVAVSGLLGW